MKNEKRKKNRDRLSVTRRLCGHARAPQRLDIAIFVYQPEDIAESAQVYNTHVCVCGLMRILYYILHGI